MKIQTVIGKEPGHVVPSALLSALVKQKPTSFGFAVQCTADDGKTPELSIIREEADPKTLMEKLEMFQENAKDFRALICFGGPDKFNPEDILPLVLNDGDDKPFMALGLEGDFPKFSEPSSGRTDEFNLASKIIIPSLLEICEMTEGDLSKIVASLGRESFNNNFLAQLGHRGILSILPLEGEFINFGKNELGEVYDWGFTSQRHGFGDAVQEPVKVVEEPKKKSFSFGNKKAVVGPPAPPQDVATAGDAPRTSVPAVAVDKAAPLKVPPWVHGNENVRSFYSMVLGRLPEGWKKRPPIIPAEGATIPQNEDELKAWLVARKKANISAAAATAVAPPKTETAAPPKSGSEVAAIREKEAAEDKLPIIGAKDMEKLLDFIAKNVDSQSVTMMKPSEVQAIEKKFGTFSSSIASTPLEMYHWPLSFWFALGKTEPRAIVLAMREFANLWYGTLKAEDLVGTVNTESVNDRGSTTTVTKTGEGTVKTESISNEPAKKKTGWFSKKAA